MHNLILINGDKIKSPFSRKELNEARNAGIKALDAFIPNWKKYIKADNASLFDMGHVDFCTLGFLIKNGIEKEVEDRNIDDYWDLLDYLSDKTSKDEYQLGFHIGLGAYPELTDAWFRYFKAEGIF